MVQGVPYSERPLWVDVLFSSVNHFELSALVLIPLSHTTQYTVPCDVWDYRLSQWIRRTRLSLEAIIAEIALARVPTVYSLISPASISLSGKNIVTCLTK